MEGFWCSWPIVFTALWQLLGCTGMKAWMVKKQQILVSSNESVIKIHKMKKKPINTLIACWVETYEDHLPVRCLISRHSLTQTKLNFCMTFFFFQQGIYGHETKTLCSTLSLPFLFSPTALGRYKKLSFILPPELHYSARLWLGTSCVLSFLLKYLMGHRVRLEPMIHLRFWLALGVVEVFLQ